MAKPDRRAGFSLIEIVIALSLMALLAGAMAPLALRQITGNRQKATLEKMKRLLAGMLGDPALGDYGYLGEMGQLPDALADLNQRGSQPAWAIDAGYGIGAGYNGPYVPQAGPANAAFVDSWGTGFQYASSAARVTSAGPDRSFGTADDLAWPATAPAVTAELRIRVEGIPNDGGPTELLDPSRVDLFVSLPVNGVRSESQLPDAEPFVRTGVPPGLHGVRAVGEGSYAGASARDVVEVRRGTRLATLVLVEPAGGGG